MCTLDGKKLYLFILCHFIVVVDGVRDTENERQRERRRTGGHGNRVVYQTFYAMLHRSEQTVISIMFANDNNKVKTALNEQNTTIKQRIHKALQKYYESLPKYWLNVIHSLLKTFINAILWFDRLKYWNKVVFTPLWLCWIVCVCMFVCMALCCTGSVSYFLGHYLL